MQGQYRTSFFRNHPKPSAVHDVVPDFYGSFNAVTETSLKELRQRSCIKKN